MKKIWFSMAALAVVAAMVTACGGSSGTGKTTDTPAAAQSTTAGSQVRAAAGGAAITIQNMAFGEALTVAPDAEITVANNDSVEHSVTSDTAGAFDVEVDSNEKKTLSAPSQPGDYPFHCKYHPNMKGTLIVK